MSQLKRIRTKNVTRRIGWKNLKPGELFQAIEKGQGLKKGEHPVKICVLKCESNREESLYKMSYDPRYGKKETVFEGFPQMSGRQFVIMFCEHNKCDPAQKVQRIEFSYV